MAISPIAMLPPFPLEIPVRDGLALAGRRRDEPADLLGLPPPAAIVAAVVAVVLPLSLGMFRLRYEINYINLFRPETRVVQDYQTVESKLGGIGLVELVVPVGHDDRRPRRSAELQRARAEGRRHPRAPNPRSIAQVLSLATVLDPDGRLAGLARGGAGPDPGATSST